MTYPQPESSEILVPDTVPELSPHKSAGSNIAFRKGAGSTVASGFWGLCPGAAWENLALVPGLGRHGGRGRGWWRRSPC